MNIGVDLDEVLALFIEDFLDWNNKEYGTVLKLSDITTFGLYQFLGCSKEEEYERFAKFNEVHPPSMLVPVEDSVDCIAELSKSHKLFSVSSRQYSIFDETIQFLYAHWNYPRVFSGCHFTNRGSKLQKCYALSLDVLVDDSAKNAVECSEVCSVFLFNRPWNEQFDEKQYSNITRVKNWQEIVELINSPATRQ